MSLAEGAGSHPPKDGLTFRPSGDTGGIDRGTTPLQKSYKIRTNAARAVPKFYGPRELDTV
jgi:hypothetical protein